MSERGDLPTRQSLPILTLARMLERYRRAEAELDLARAGILDACAACRTIGLHVELMHEIGGELDGLGEAPIGELDQTEMTLLANADTPAADGGHTRLGEISTLTRAGKEGRR